MNNEWDKQKIIISTIVFTVILAVFPSIWLPTVLSALTGIPPEVLVYPAMVVAFILCLPGSMYAHQKLKRKP